MPYEAATTEEIAIVMEATRTGKSIPSGFAINWEWNPPVMRVVGSGSPPPAWSGPETTLLDARMDALEALDIPTALGTKANASTVGALTTRVTSVEAPLANVTFNPDGSIVDTGSIPATTTFNADGTITTVYGAPLNRTVVTTFNADGSITEALA